MCETGENLTPTDDWRRKFELCNLEEKGSPLESFLSENRPIPQDLIKELPELANLNIPKGTEIYPMLDDEDTIDA